MQIVQCLKAPDADFYLHLQNHERAPTDQQRFNTQSFPEPNRTALVHKPGSIDSQ